MHVKELERYAFTAWSPAVVNDLILATITAEDGASPTESSNPGPSPVLELFKIDLKDPSLVINSAVAVPVESPSTSFCWTTPSGTANYGLLVAGDAVGGLTLFDPHALFQSHNSSESNDFSSHPLATLNAVHTGVVRSLDSNRFQTNLFASVADESELLIWDVEKLDQRMSPGSKVQPPEPINTVSWNPRVQHILATASMSHCTIWDLRRSDPVVHLTKAMCQFEPRLIIWSPDVATRLCLADPACPTADVQLWDLRYPKHMLALIGRWPPSNSDLGQVALGNAGTVNSLAWSPSPDPGVLGRPALGLHDSDLIAVSVTASGALPTCEGSCGTNLQPTSAEFLVVWSVNEGLQTAHMESKLTMTALKPMFIGRLGDNGYENALAMDPDGLPSNSAVHWLSSVPGLVSVTHSESWTSILNLTAGTDCSYSSALARQSSRIRVGSRSRHASHKVAEAFGDEVDLSNSSPSPIREFGNPFPEVSMSLRGSSHAESCGQQSLPQPLPYLRVAPRWMKRRCGAQFCFGGRLVWFANNTGSSDFTHRPTNTPNLQDSKDHIVRTVHIHQVNTTDNCPMRALKSSSEMDFTHLSQTLITWLYSALTSSSTEALSRLCDDLSVICKPHPLMCQSMQVDPWSFLRAKLQHTLDNLPSIFSELLGYSPQSIRVEVDRVLNEPDTLPLNVQCLCQSHDAKTKTNSILRTMKLALVTADLASASLLSLNRSLSSVSCPGLSPLAFVAIMLSTQLGMTELYSSARKTILSCMNQVADLKDSNLSHFRTVTLLLSALVSGDWPMVLSQWPLDDWFTLLAAIVNHLSANNPTLFKGLCAALIDRLLDTQTSCSLDRSELCTAAWICAACSGNVDGLINAWYGLDPLAQDDADGQQLMPLALQLALVTRCQNPPGESVSISPLVAQIFSSVASWLCQVGSDSDTDSCNVLAGLHLLQQCISQNMRSSVIEEVAHRLWCALTDDERRASNIDPRKLFTCPYESKNNRCPCGLTSSKVVEYVPLGAAASASLQSTSHSRSPVAAPIYSSNGVYERTMMTMMPNSTMGPMPPLPGTVAPHTNFVVKPHMPAFSTPTACCIQSHPPLPPVMSMNAGTGDLASLPPNVGIQSAPSLFSAAPTQTLFPLPQASASQPEFCKPHSMNLAAERFPPPDVQGLQLPPPALHQQSTVPKTCPPAASSTNGSVAWNDPPLLAHTYETPSPPAVSVNHFYDPAQYSAPSIGPPNLAAPAGGNSSEHSKQPPARSVFPVKPVPSAIVPGPPQLVSLPNSTPPMPPFNFSTSTLPNNRPPIPPVPVSCLPQRHTKFADENSGGEIGAGGVDNLAAFQPSVLSSLSNTQWPAAVPLGVGPQGEISGIMEQPPPTYPYGQSCESTVPPAYTSPPNPEFEAIVNTLTRLIQSCRSVGGKSYMVKMDTVERRLSALFQTLRTNCLNLADPVMNHLRACVEAAARSDFNSAVVHSNLLIQSASGFESIHGFAPGLKILMQTARQLFPAGSSFPNVTALTDADPCAVWTN